MIKTGTVQCVSDGAAVLGKATAAVTILTTLNFVTHWLALFKIVCNLKRSQLTLASVLFLQTRDVNVKLKKCSYTCNEWKFCREVLLKTFTSHAWIPTKILNFSSFQFKPVCGFSVNIYEILWQAEPYVLITNNYYTYSTFQQSFPKLHTQQSPDNGNLLLALYLPANHPSILTLHCHIAYADGFQSS